MRILNLTLKKKWFDMIASGEKKEEYREIKPYWIKRLLNNNFDAVQFRNGYSKDAPTILIECKGVDIGTAKPEWSDNWEGNVFIIKLGGIISEKQNHPHPSLPME